VCFMRICDNKFAVYGFFAEHRMSHRYILCAAEITNSPITGTTERLTVHEPRG
jgi:hypothetical protein